jgi:S1-C subfamily serine protease
MSPGRGAEGRGRLVAVAVLAACLGLVGGGLGAWAVYARLGPATSTTTVPIKGEASGASVSSLAAAAAPSLVTVVTQPVTAQGLLGGSAGFANGFVVSADGLIVTTAHAVQGASRLRVGLADGRPFDCVIAATDVPHGLVVLRAVGATNLTPLGFASAPAQPGDTVIAVSRPPLGATSLGLGTVSSTGRAVEIDRAAATSVLDALTVDAAAEPQADGAPLLDGSGKVTGVVVTVTGATAPPGLTALSARAASALVDRAGSGGHTAGPAFGADSALVDPATAAASGLPAGALVRSVDASGAMAAAGIHPGDIVTSVNGVAIDSGHPLDAAALQLSVGQHVRLTVVSAGVTRTVDVVVGSGP